MKADRKKPLQGILLLLALAALVALSRSPLKETEPSHMTAFIASKSLNWPYGWSRKSLQALSPASSARLTLTYPDSKCITAWIMDGRPCTANLTPSTLDLVWSWRNESDVSYILMQELQGEAADGTRTRTPSIDTLRYSLRSGQRHMGSGFGDVVIVAPDFEETHDIASSAISFHRRRKALLKSFSLLRKLRSLLLLEKLSQSDTLDKSSALNVSVNSESKSLIHQQFHDEIGNVRYSQRPSWLAAGSRSQYIKLKALWELACPSHLHTQEIEPLEESKSYMRKKISKGSSQALVESGSSLWTIVASYACKQRLFPTFNHNVVKSIVAEYKSQSKAFVLSDSHHFFGKQVDSSTFYSPLYGPIFRPSRSGVGYGEAARLLARDTATLSQISANTLLGQRFGHRDRARLVDVPTIVVADLQREAKSVWQSTLSHVSNRAGESPAYEIDFLFLYFHYIVERHREALLWSFFIAKHDTSGGNRYSPQDVTRLLDDLGFTRENIPQDGESKVALRASQSSDAISDKYRKAHTDLGLEDPLVDSIGFTSQNGYFGTWVKDAVPTLNEDLEEEQEETAENRRSDFPPACSLSSICFAPLRNRIVSPTHLFRHMTFQHWGCGDCVIQVLLGKTNHSSLAPVLPRANLKFPSVQPLPHTREEASLPAEDRFEMIDFSLEGIAERSNRPGKDRLTFVAGLLSRYRYAIDDIGSSSGEHRVSAILEDETSEKSILLELEKAEPRLFSLINRSKKNHSHIDKIIIAWLATKFGEPLDAEKK